MCLFHTHQKPDTSRYTPAPSSHPCPHSGPCWLCSTLQRQVHLAWSRGGEATGGGPETFVLTHMHPVREGRGVSIGWERWGKQKGCWESTPFPLFLHLFLKLRKARTRPKLCSPGALCHPRSLWAGRQNSLCQGTYPEAGIHSSLLWVPLRRQRVGREPPTPSLREVKPITLVPRQQRF